MGYYAHGNGDLLLREPIPDEILESLVAFDEADNYIRKCDGNNSNYLSLVHYDDKYHEDDIYYDLRKVEPYVVDGSVDFVGEDECIWRFRYDPKLKRFVEESGRIAYDYGDTPVVGKQNGDRLEFLNSIIEVFETFLDEKGIIIDNPDKAQDANTSNIYGCDYGDLESELEHVLIGWGVLT